MNKKNLIFSMLIFAQLIFANQYDFPARLTVNKSSEKSAPQFVELKLDCKNDDNSSGQCAKIIPFKFGFRIDFFESRTACGPNLKYQIFFRFLKNNTFSLLLKEYSSYFFGILGSISWAKELINIPSLQFHAYRIAREGDEGLAMWIRGSDDICLNSGSFVNYVIDTYNKGLFSPKDAGLFANWRKYLAQYDAKFFCNSRTVIQVLPASRDGNEDLLPESQSIFEVEK